MRPPLYARLAPFAFAAALTCCRPEAQPDRPAAARRQFWALYVQNLETADWYSRNFGMKVMHTIDGPDGSFRAKILESDAATLELKMHRDAAPRPPPGADGKEVRTQGYMKVGWFVPDLRAEFERLGRNGVTVLLPVTEQKAFGIRFFIVSDPEGNPIQIFERID